MNDQKSEFPCGDIFQAAVNIVSYDANCNKHRKADWPNIIRGDMATICKGCKLRKDYLPF